MATAPPHAVELRTLGADPVTGLDDAAAARRLAEVGPNALVEPPPPSAWRRFARQLDELVVWILLGAAGIAAATGGWTDAGAILGIVLLNAVLGFVQEERAGRALAALRTVASPLARVVRGGRTRTLAAEELVPGDRIDLEAGDRVPADARLVEAHGLRLEEAILTGESVPTEKEATGPLPRDTPLASRSNLVHMGTLVVAGSASAMVVATGMRTELGRIAELVQRHRPDPTPLQVKLAELGRVLLVACLGVCAGLFALEALRGGSLGQALLLSVSLAVAVVPEGLPAVVTVALAIGLQRLARRSALVRRLPSVETLGAVTVICSDKTGTLTRNEMTVRELRLADRTLTVTGAGYEPRGEVHGPDGARLAWDDPALRLALTIGVRCATARLVAPPDPGGRWSVVGDPTEGALLVLGLKGGLEPGGPVLAQLPFDTARKAMSVVVPAPDGPVMYTKGAPEALLRRCVAERRADGVEAPLDDAGRARVLAAAHDMAARALRVLALARRQSPALGADGAFLEEGLVLVGLVGMLDPPRDEARAAVATCAAAGIRPVMITGDHPATALAIARELGLATSEGQVASGVALDALDDDALAARVEGLAVYARVTAEHKLRIVTALRRRGHVVAMTGDGVNDAPAIRAADIGIAMGRSGTEVTKQAAALVLVDDDFSSIVGAIEEGRAIYDNIQRVVLFLLSSNVGELLLIVLAALLGWPAPLLAVQLLWINLVTDGVPALALVLEPPERDIMSRPPRPPREPVLTRLRVLFLLALGALVAEVAAIGFQRAYGGDPANLERARTIAFCVTAWSQLFLALCFRSSVRTLPELGVFTNPALLGAIAASALLQLATLALPFGRALFGTTNPPASEWAVALGLALVPVSAVEVAKLVRSAIDRLRGRHIHETPVSPS